VGEADAGAIESGVAIQPIAELFGFPPDNNTEAAERHRKNKLCPYNNKVPNCTKDSVIDPLGVCSIFHGKEMAVICPVRLREDWMIAGQAADFFFPAGTAWTTLLEVRINDREGKSAGNIDVVIVAYDASGKITDFGSLEIQTVYISGNLRRNFFNPVRDDRAGYLAADWSKSRKQHPHPDYLSSSRKRLAPQLIFKGGILKAWGKKQAIAVHISFYKTLPKLRTVPREQADLAWLVYDLVFDSDANRYHLKLIKTVYTKFSAALKKITRSKPGNIDDFTSILQGKLEAKLSGTPAVEISDISADVPADEPDIIDELENI